MTPKGLKQHKKFIEYMEKVNINSVKNNSIKEKEKFS